METLFNTNTIRPDVHRAYDASGQPINVYEPYGPAEISSIVSTLKEQTGYRTFAQMRAEQNVGNGNGAHPETSNGNGNHPVEP